jgi:hypothetical protein
VEVSAHDGRVVLKGSVPSDETSGLVSAVWGVRGVREVDDRTTRADEAGAAQVGDRPELLQANWAPATRLFMGGLGTWLMLNCLVRRTPSAIGWGTLGFGLLLNSMANCSQLGVPSREAMNEFEADEDSLMHAGDGRNAWTPRTPK